MASGSSVDEDHRVVDFAASIFMPQKTYSQMRFIVHK